ncbi:UDP-N-acetylmuramyl pentapeptide phosphotransferase/UDP-N-acetylglucosamine-1-phosphate transferase [Solitalea canadensis DSM 3403]|uniref:UDP-N-acetylmuramyl pentapeptide phosphotransferase/UDP-N-acetylglucosamine-1-phosphate transferase n=1 Tax=Solitalea canadensis (strain ATCC 29591 / DSM 3403 / JCM 21819 / LMG 8368 / NBRC 15130 / NCIMB 12057 / USAM 9D) TaxID=929556 RepID=H8KMR5_SOLCM|nr:UDP-N-acetylmuramyl pentapeptide phosphotransferase/UDP-N-acetylglucosamine-1-phosphate transferase [Solitalea canadensis DSM 3403]
MVLHLLIFLSSLLVVSFSIPSIIYVAFRKRLFDAPNEDRKIHKKIIPNLGGVAIFTGFLFSTSLFIKSSLLPEAGIVLAAGIILFVVGLKDDLVGMSPVKKLMAQVLAALIIAVLADIRLKSMFGLFGVQDIAYPVSIAITVFTIVAIVNAFNLVDGIDGLAGGIGLVVSITYALLFYLMGDIGWSFMATALGGSLVGFLIYNVSPAKIFMGDTGSLLVGLIASVLSIQLIELSSVHSAKAVDLGIQASPALVLAVLIIPVFDTTRVFTLRILKKQSPFTADRNHLHHRLIDLKLSHTSSALILLGVNITLIFFAISLQRIGTLPLILAIASTVIIANIFLTLLLKYKTSKLPNSKRSTQVKDKPVLKTEKEQFVDSILEKIAKN